MTMPNGLDQMEAARDARKAAAKGRNIPRSRNGPRQTPVEHAANEEVETEAPAEAVKVSTSAEEPLPESSLETTGGGQGSVIKRTIHLGRAEDEFLEDIFIAGRRAPGGRVDANRSAAVRLAIRRLREELSPDQIVNEIRQGTTKPTTGRPRF
jgi:hypothetical protein